MKTILSSIALFLTLGAYAQSWNVPNPWGGLWSYSATAPWALADRDYGTDLGGINGIYLSVDGPNQDAQAWFTIPYAGQAQVQVTFWVDGYTMPKAGDTFALMWGGATIPITVALSRTSWQAVTVTLNWPAGQSRNKLGWWLEREENVTTSVFVEVGAVQAFNVFPGPPVQVTPITPQGEENS